MIKYWSYAKPLLRSDELETIRRSRKAPSCVISRPNAYYIEPYKYQQIIYIFYSKNCSISRQFLASILYFLILERFYTMSCTALISRAFQKVCSIFNRSLPTVPTTEECPVLRRWSHSPIFRERQWMYETGTVIVGFSFWIQWGVFWNKHHANQQLGE